MKILVTGANGFLAGHVINRLFSAGYTVKAMMRDGANAHSLKESNVEIFRGKITDPAAVELAVKGCTHIIHIAADTSQSHRSHSDYLPVNTYAVKTMLECAIKEGCKRFIFISSANTIGYGTLDHPATEKNTASPLFCKSGYANSKMLAENIILQDHYMKSIDIIVLNPSFLIGPEDYNPHSGKIFNMILHKKLAFYPPGGKNFIDVRDAADAVISSMHKGNNGERYLLTGTNLSYKDFFLKVAACEHQKKWLFPIPKSILILAGFLGSIVRCFGIKTSLSLTNTRILCIGNYYSNQKARSTLNLSIRNIDETIADRITWTESLFEMQ